MCGEVFYGNDRLISKLWYNPKCSKCRKALSLLEEKEVAVQEVRYLEDPPGLEQLEEVLSLLCVEPREIMRKTENVYSEMDLGNPLRSREELMKAMIENPVLIQRPIFVHQGRAVIARPPEKVLELV